jgi:excisionase family DNA binding protein
MSAQPEAYVSVAYSPEQYAAKLSVSVKTIYRQIKNGTIKAERIGRQWRIVRYIAKQRHA